MKERFNASQISKVIDQALIYQCACPAQVCRAIFELRELYEYQMKCVNESVNDVRVHQNIAQTTEAAHSLMEQCLQDILEMEGWDQNTFLMPESLKKKPSKSI